MNEKDRILNMLVESEKSGHENFVSENPETNLPSSVEVGQVMEGASTPVKGGMVSEVPVTPEASLKEPNSSELWNEVVRRGRYKNRNRDEHNKIDSHDRCILEC
jgi:hypothetical protein